jgi:sarcosine oxidase/L-pipecolate oxidase
MDPSHQEQNDSYVIVGAGVFGASAALEIKRSKPQASVILLDRSSFPNPAAASFDLNKIIRADYRDILYMKLALEALAAWESDPLYKPHYHETGMMFAENAGKGPSFLINYKLLGQQTKAQLMPVEMACALFPMLRNANWSGVKQAYYNPRSGWGDAAPALRSVIQAALDLGVVYTQATVEKLSLEDTTHQQGPDTVPSYQCVGVELADGLVIKADHVLLCAGAATARLLAQTFPDEAIMQVQGRLVAAAALSCMIRVDPDKWDCYRHAPVLANLMPHTYGVCFAFPYTCPSFPVPRILILEGFCLVSSALEEYGINILLTFLSRRSRTHDSGRLHQSQP